MWSSGLPQASRRGFGVSISGQELVGGALGCLFQDRSCFRGITFLAEHSPGPVYIPTCKFQLNKAAEMLSLECKCLRVTLIMS